MSLTQQFPNVHVVHASESYYLRAFGVASVILYILCAALACRADQLWAAAGFTPFILLSCLLLFGLGWVEVDEYALVRHCSFGTYIIKWDEVEAISTDGMTLIFQGAEKRFVFVPSYLARVGRREVLSVLDAQLQQRQLSVKYERFASYRFQKNTRVR